MAEATNKEDAARYEGNTISRKTPPPGWRSQTKDQVISGQVKVKLNPHEPFKMQKHFWKNKFNRGGQHTSFSGIPEARIPEFMDFTPSLRDKE